jgi:hypothetical protein
MELENHKEEVPFAHYAGLFREIDPEKTAAHCGAAFQNGAFGLTLLGERYEIAWPEYAIRAEREDAFALGNLPTQTFLLRYLLEGKKAAPFTEFRTFREMPWGEMYITPYTGRVLKRAAFSFAGKLPAFSAACEKMGAAPVGHGDAGWQFELLPGYFMQILLWAGDEEFAPSAQVLYSDNFAEAFAAEDRVVAGDILISAVRNHLS